MNYKLHIPTKQVLVEKGPFYVLINELSTFDNSELWYCGDSNKSFLVRLATSEDIARLTNTTDITFKDLYVTCGEERNKGWAIYKKHCKKI